MSHAPSRWGLRDTRPSPRDAALLAEVLAAANGGLATAPHGAPAIHAPDEAAVLPEQVQQLIAAAVTELNRLSLDEPLRGSGAPVLGGGVVPELLRRRQIGGGGTQASSDESRIDTRR